LSGDHWRSTAKTAILGAILATGIATTASMASAAPAATASTRAASWHLAFRAPVRYEIQGISAPSRDQGWALGSVYTKRNALVRSFYLHWNGRSWSQASIHAAAGFVAEQIVASSPGNVWIFGYRPHGGSAALVYNGHGWKIIPSPSTPIGPSVVASGTDVWMTVQSDCPSVGCSTTVANWDGSGWKSYSVPGQLYLAGGGVRPWLVGVRRATVAGKVVGLGTVYRWNGTSWQRLMVPARVVARAIGVAAPGGRLWLAAKRPGPGPWRLYEWHRSTWSRLRTPRSFNPGESSSVPVYDGRNGFWALPFHWTGTKWVDTAPGLPFHPWWLNTFWYNNVAPVPGSSDVWAVVLANQSRTTDTQTSAIAYYGGKP